MSSRKRIGIAESRLKRTGGVFLRALLIVAMASCCGYSAWAKPKKKKTPQSSKKIPRKPVSLDEVPLDPGHYPIEISKRIMAYNADVKEINAERKKDPRLAKARGEVLKIQKESYELYTSFMDSMDGRDADKIRKTVAGNAWYKGMPQIAFLASMGLPDDIGATPAKDGGLTLIYKSTSFYFEKGRLRSFVMPHS